MKRPTKTIPLGAPLDTPDDELTLLALITREDIEAAKADGRARMSRLGRALLEAAPAEETTPDEPLPL